MVCALRSDRSSLWATLESLGPKMGRVPQALNKWVNPDEIDKGDKACATTTDQPINRPDLQQPKEHQRENTEPPKANEILTLGRHLDPLGWSSTAV